LDSEQVVAIAVLSTEQDDVEIVNSTVRGAGFAARCQWIRGPQEFEQVLAEGNAELIILNCDSYPDSIRQIISQKDSFQPEVPVLAASRQVDESRIQKAMEAGACDLVSMENKSRIRTVFLRELRSCRVERALNSTIQSATEYRRQLNFYMQGSTSAIAYVREGIVVKANKVWLSLFKVKDESEVQGMPLMDYFTPQSQAAVKGAIVATTKGKWQVDEKLVAKANIEDQQDTELELGLQLIDYGDGAQVQIRIEPPREAPEEPTMIVHEALKRDPTTLFFNRTTFLDRVKRRLSKKPSSGQYSLAYIKPDKFSAVRSTVGILATEDVLSQFAEEVRKRMHPRDMAGRFEGTSLLVLLHRGNERDAEVWGQQLVDHIGEQVFKVGDGKVRITCSVGVVPFSGVYSTMEEFVASVVTAYERGKSDGGNCVQLGDSNDESSRLRKYDAIWIKRIKAALIESRFRLAQLPIAGLRRDSVKMFDMLVRMIDEQGNAILPAEFVAPAERNNLMKMIDRWIVMASADYCREERVDRVFVRLSQQSICDEKLSTWMEKEICGRRVEPSLLCVQVPEQVAAKCIKDTKRAADGLRELGIGFALEHYGVNRNRFQILDVLRPDYIKIDGELMHTLTSDTPMQEKVLELAEAAAERNIQTIAERVENANTMAVLFQLGVDFMQGHYVHEPEVVLQEPVNVAQTTLEAIAGS
jgi:diguanylate cyclase (GGDEF)-like protein